MNFFTIAGITIATEGIQNDFFEKRMRAYRSAEQEADLTVFCKEVEEIQKPIGIEIATMGERHWVQCSDGFGFYDAIPDGRIVASVLFRNQGKEVYGELLDVSGLGGADWETRSFNLVGEAFRYSILQHDGLVLHSSSLAYQGNGILFSAPSGTGKSTHTGLWREHFGADVIMVNDDTPAIRFRDGIPFLCGTPWSGKTDINANVSVPLRGIVFLRQAPENRIIPLTPTQGLPYLMNEVLRSVYTDLLEQTLHYLEQLVQTVPMYLLECTISKEAAELSRSILK